MRFLKCLYHLFILYQHVTVFLEIWKQKYYKACDLTILQFLKIKRIL